MLKAMITFGFFVQFCCSFESQKLKYLHSIRTWKNSETIKVGGNNFAEGWNLIDIKKLEESIIPSIKVFEWHEENKRFFASFFFLFWERIDLIYLKKVYVLSKNSMLIIQKLKHRI